MLTHFGRTPAILIRFTFVLLIVSACLALLFHLQRSSIADANISAAAQSQRHCPSCPPPSPRRIYAPAIDLNEAQSCEIVLNSRSSHPIDVTPTFYTASGDAIVGNPVQLQPAEIRYAPVEQLMPESIRGTHRWGGIALSYTGNVLEVWAQITFHGIGGGSIDETFNILEEPGSDTREAVWWMPEHGMAIVALGNTSSATVHANVQFSNADCEDIAIPAGMTKFIRRHAQANQSQSDSVRIVTADAPGAVRLAAFIVGDDNNFASSIRFYDTKKTVQPNLFALNLRLKNGSPRIVLKNTSDAPVTARPRFFTAKGEQDNPVDLSAMTLLPQQIVDLNLSALRAAAASRTDLDSVEVRVENTGAPGTLIGAAYSTNQATGLTYDVPLRDSGKVRNATGSYPWRVDEDYSTIVVLRNVGDQPARFQVELRYPGGPYSIKQRELAVGESASFDLREIRDQQQPDRTGKTLPSTLDRGQFHWSIVATPGDARIIGRAEVVSRSGRVVSSYSCPVCCPDSGPYGGFNPNAYTLAIDGHEFTSASGDYYDCYFNYYTGSLWWSSLWTNNTSVASVTYSNAELYGAGVGETDVVGVYQYVYWENDGMDCYQRYDSGSDSAPVDVQCPTPTGETTAGIGWKTDNPTTYEWVQTLTPSTTNFAGRFVVEFDPGGGGPDTCHFNGSQFDEFTSITAGSWQVESGNRWEPDGVGWNSTAVTYYRNHGRAPCGTTFPQLMKIDCGNGATPYITNTLACSFTATTVTSTRAGQTATRNWP